MSSFYRIHDSLIEDNWGVTEERDYGDYMETNAQGEASQDQTDHGQNEVTVEINGQPKKIHRGDYTTEMLKSVLGVDLSLDLELFEGGKFVTLTDDQRIVVREGMVFVSH